LSPFEERHPVGSGQGVEHEIIVVGRVVFAAEQVVISVVIWGIRKNDRGVGMAGLEEEPKKSKRREIRQTEHEIHGMRLRHNRKV
jgi:hypothetical protein